MALQTQKSERQIHFENLKHATIVARNSLFILVCLALIKAFGGYVTNIIALIGDAVGSFSDIIATSGIYVGLKLSQRQASKTFKYGYHKIETFISLLISIFILYAGYRIFRESLSRFFIEAQTSAHNIGMLTAVISICVSVVAFYYQRKTGEKINSNALLASAYDKRNDAFVSLGVLASVIADKFKIQYVEGGIGILISAMILWTGIKYGKDALFYLLDYWNEPKITAKIRALLLKSKIVTAVKNIRLRHAGTYIFGEAFLEINPFTDINDLRDEIHKLNKLIEQKIPHLGDFVLYVDPPRPQKMVVAIPVSDGDGLHSKIASRKKEFFHLLVAEIKNRKIINFFITKETFDFAEAAKITKFLKDHRVNIFISSNVQTLLFYPLRLANIRIYPQFFNVEDAEHTIKLLLLDYY